MNCTYCDGFHFIRPDNGWGQIIRCPVCSCDRCERLRWTDPDEGGCICSEKKGRQAKKRAVIASNNRSPQKAVSSPSVPPTPAAVNAPASPLIVARYEP